jgi:type IV secretory pathway ATPase VirB11/archaellum biosynthesis ATPase
MNKKYSEALKKASKKIYREYTSKGKFTGSLIVGGISDVEINGQSIWPKKTGYEYELIFKKPFRKHYYLVSFLSRKKYEIGQVLKGEVILQYDYAKVKILKEKNKIIKDLHHERKLPLLGEVTIK